MKVSAEESIRSIETAKVPTTTLVSNLRGQGQAARTKAIRETLKHAGIKGVSVRKAVGSMCYWTNVDIPRLWWVADGKADREACVRREHAARDKVQAIILAAYPDLDDRSDSMTDHFDLVFTVGIGLPGA